MSQYAVERWGVERGFSRGPVYSIGQSGDGYLVIAKLNGLLRFDGFSFGEMHSADVEPLLSQVVRLVTDAQGALWLGLSASGSTMLRYQNGAYRNVVADLPVLLAVDAIARGRDGAALCLVNHQVGASVGGRSADSGIAPC